MGRYPQMRRRPLTAGAIAARRMRWTRLVTLPTPGESRARISPSARRRAGGRGELYIVVGAVVALAHDAKPVTEDELTSGAERMAAEADLYLIEWYERRPDQDTGPTE